MVEKWQIKAHEKKTIRLRNSVFVVVVLAQNINLFLTGIEGILENAPVEVGKFHFVEFTVSAEISSNGKLVLLGSGLEAAAKGGIAFKFVRKVEKGE